MALQGLELFAVLKADDEIVLDRLFDRHGGLLQFDRCGYLFRAQPHQRPVDASDQRRQCGGWNWVLGDIGGNYFGTQGDEAIAVILVFYLDNPIVGVGTLLLDVPVQVSQITRVWASAMYISGSAVC